VSKAQNYLLTEVTFSANFDPNAKLIDVIMVDKDSKEAKAAKPLEAGQFAAGHDDSAASNTPASPAAGAAIHTGSSPLTPMSPLASASGGFVAQSPQSAAESAEAKAKREKEARQQLFAEALRAEKEALEAAEQIRKEREEKEKAERARIQREREEAERIPDVPAPKDPFAAKVQQIRLRAARDKRVAAFLAKQQPSASTSNVTTGAPSTAGTPGSTAGTPANGHQRFPSVRIALHCIALRFDVIHLYRSSITGSFTLGVCA
jgi:hypothetical protein